MSAFTTAARILGPVAFASLISGCAGGGLSSSTPGQPQNAAPAANSRSLTQSASVHSDSKKVQVAPHKVAFTTANPGPQAVTVTGPSGTASIVETDNCASRNIATIAGAGSSWTATAGSAEGVCQAQFTALDANGNELGMGTLLINNSIGDTHGNVQVTPNKVVLTTANPSATTTVTGPTGTASIVESDNCAARNIATVAGAGSSWTATAGTAAGVCHAKFTAKDANGNTLGSGNLKITNTL